MIPAGILKYNLKFQSLNKTQSESGFITSEKVDAFSTKAQKIKNSGKMDVDGKEIFLNNQIIFKIRFNKLFNENQTVIYNDVEYRIIFSEIDQFENSIKITLEKMNK